MILPPPGRTVTVEVVCLHERSCEHKVTGKVYKVADGLVHVGGSVIPVEHIKRWRPAARPVAA